MVKWLRQATKEDAPPFPSQTLEPVVPCKSALQVSLGRITLHATCPTPHGASHLVHARSAWSVKIRRAPPLSSYDDDHA